MEYFPSPTLSSALFAGALAFDSVETWDDCTIESHKNGSEIISHRKKKKQNKTKQDHLNMATQI